MGRPLLLLVDDANAIPPERAVGLAGLVRANGALRLLLVPMDDARAARVLAVLARDVAELRVSTPLSLEEAEHYVRTRLVRAGVSFEVQRRFDAGIVRRLHRATGGNPQHLQQLAGEVLRGNLAALPGQEEVELDAPDRDATPAIEIDALEALEVRPAAAVPPPPPAWAAATPVEGLPDLDGERSVRPPPSERVAAAGPALPSAPPQAPNGPPGAAGTNWAVVIGVNVALPAGALLGLWVSGFLPPPR